MQSFGLDPLTFSLVLASLALIPLLLMITTSFLKIAIVLNLVRNAMGVQQLPPNMVLYAICLALTLFVMAPVFHEIHSNLIAIDFGSLDRNDMLATVEHIGSPLKSFMTKHVSPDVLIVFQDAAKSLWGKEIATNFGSENLLILIPAFVVSELQAGFEIGFLIFLPFLIIDLIISNLLLALGMQMVSPMTISLPLKILLFVMVGGWEKLLHALVISYI